MSEAIERQIALEEEAVSLGRDRYNQFLESRVEKDNADQTAPAQQLIRRSINLVAEAIDLDRNTPRRGRGRSYLHLIADIEAQVLAWHTLRSLMERFTARPTYTATAVRVSHLVEQEINFRQFKEANPKRHDLTQQYIKKEASGHRRTGIMKRLTKGESKPVKWTNEEQIRVGSYLLDIALQVTQWADARNLRKNRQTIRVVAPRQEILDWLEQAHAHLAELHPVRMPMVVPPVDWSTPYDGGYITNHTKALMGMDITLVKSFNSDYIKELEGADLSEVYGAVNAIQRTAWRINKRVLAVAQALWEEGVAVGKRGAESLPARHPLEQPSFPPEYAEEPGSFKAADPEGWKLWCKRAAAVHDENRRLVSKRIAGSTKMNIAVKFQDEDAIYFPHQLDFRGRVYPLPSHLNPQGDDLAKGLLEFSEGKPLGEDGVAWLFVHTANCFGVDKVSYEERIEWVKRNMDTLLDSGMEPVEGERFWMTADDPFMALAACFELAGWAIAGEDYVSHISVSMDGSCNGLQNFSALLKDAVGGLATNLVPQEKPADIYAQVAELVAESVAEDALAGDERALQVDGIVNRSLVKQPVMTLPYGATRRGMQDQIEGAIRKAGNPTGIGTRSMWPVCGYLAGITYDRIGEVVIAARSAMDWLQDVAQAVASEDRPIRWTTPAGLPVLQEYRQFSHHRIYIYVDGVKQRLTVTEQGKQLDTRRQRAGIAPNLIHSFDAAHLMKTVNLGSRRGLDSFAMIHDSYGTHACDVPLLHECLRRAFVDMYSEPLLERFKDEVAEQVSEDAELPDLPPSGDLDLECIMESAYFFA